MKSSMNFKDACQKLIDLVEPVKTEKIALAESAGRILAEAVVAGEDVPPFDRSPYDGYAFRAVDTSTASKETPITLQILEEVPAGAVPTKECVAGTATKILTGAPIPKGADAVIMYERTEFTSQTVTIFGPVKEGDNIVYAGEDVKCGAVLATAGGKIDAGTMGTLASQGIGKPVVYQIPKIGIISTGNEVVDVESELTPGKIYNSNRYTLTAAVKEIGCEPVFLGIAGDTTEGIANLLLEGLKTCDAILTTGGVSVGDYDLTPAAMELAGVEILFRGVDLKPGMACAYGSKDGKLICGLSGNPASSLINYYAVAMPALKKLTGAKNYVPEEIDVILNNGFKKKSPGTRLLRGTLDLSCGEVRMSLPKEQGNVMLNSMIGCNVMAIVPAGSGPIEAGTKLKGFLL